MKRLMLILLLAGTNLNLIASATPFSRDTVGLDTPYCLPSWKVRQIYNIALAAQDLVESQALTIEDARITISAADSVVDLQQKRLINVLGQANACAKQLLAQEDITANERKKKRRRGWIIAGLVTAWIVVEVLQAR